MTDPMTYKAKNVNYHPFLYGFAEWSLRGWVFVECLFITGQWQWFSSG